jgi:hypothetical protein
MACFDCSKDVRPSRIAPRANISRHVGNGSFSTDASVTSDVAIPQQTGIGTAGVYQLGHEPTNALCERLASVRVPPLADVLLHGNETTRWARFRRFDLTEHQIG